MADAGNAAAPDAAAAPAPPPPPPPAPEADASAAVAAVPSEPTGPAATEAPASVETATGASGDVAMQAATPEAAATAPSVDVDVGAAAAPDSNIGAAPATAGTPVQPEPPTEAESDAQPDSREKLKEEVCFLTNDTTLNVLPSSYGTIVMSLTEGGMQYLLAGARANVGIKDGRYLFETKIVEVLSPTEVGGPQKGKTGTPQPRQLLRVGFSLAGSSLFLGDTEASVCFDSEGTFTFNRKAVLASQRFARDQVVGVLLNLDPNSPNANTVSLFRDGVRVSQPQPLPEELKGKPLFPTLTFRNVTVNVNFGSEPMAKMPFVCRAIQDAAKDDVTVIKYDEPKDGKYDAIFPTGLPDEGMFDWLDMFMDKHPDYVELSDRKILDWAAKSGVWRPRGYSWRSSNDKPEMQFGIPQMDDLSIRDTLYQIAPVQKRNFVIMEVKSNLVKEERAELIKLFSLNHKRIAKIIVGEPAKEIKDKNHAALLREKQEKSDVEFKTRKLEAERKKLILKRQKELEREKRRQERAEKKAAAEVAKAAAAKAAEASKEAEAAKAPEEAEATKEGDTKMAEDDKKPEETAKVEEETKAAEDEEDDKSEPDDEEMLDAAEETPPQVELTEEDKKQWFRKQTIPDLTPMVQAASFTKFSLPTKEEGFEETVFEWQKKAKSSEHVKDWILHQKLVSRVEDLQPSDWFREQHSSWTSQLQRWHQGLKDWKDPVKQAALKQQKDAAAMGEGEAKEGQVKEPKPEAEDDDELDIKEIDVFGVQDVNDIGGGEPLYGNFEFEDWALMSLRFELHLLAHAFKRDVGDPERLGIHQDNIPFYYNKYFRKAFSTRYYGVETYEELVHFIKDTVTIEPKNKVLQAHIPAELDSCDLFLKLTEECRRDREMRIDSGDESAAIKFAKPTPPAASQASAGGSGNALAAMPQQPRPYQRGPRPPVPGKGYGGPVGGKSGPCGYQQGAPQGYTGKGSYNKGAPPPASGVRPGGGYGSAPYGGAGPGGGYMQKRPYNGGGYSGKGYGK